MLPDQEPTTTPTCGSAQVGENVGEAGSALGLLDTVPFLQPDPRAVIPSVESAGKAFYKARARHMVATDQGPTTYNTLKGPETRTPPSRLIYRSFAPLTGDE